MLRLLTTGFVGAAAAAGAPAVVAGPPLAFSPALLPAGVPASGIVITSQGVTVASVKVCLVPFLQWTDALIVPAPASLAAAAMTGEWNNDGANGGCIVYTAAAGGVSAQAATVVASQTRFGSWAPYGLVPGTRQIVVTATDSAGGVGASATTVVVTADVDNTANCPVLTGEPIADTVVSPTALVAAPINPFAGLTLTANGDGIAGLQVAITNGCKPTDLLSLDPAKSSPLVMSVWDAVSCTLTLSSADLPVAAYQAGGLEAITYSTTAAAPDVPEGTRTMAAFVLQAHPVACDSSVAVASVVVGVAEGGLWAPTVSGTATPSATGVAPTRSRTASVAPINPSSGAGAAVLTWSAAAALLLLALAA